LPAYSTGVDNTMKFVHVLAAIAWVGGSIMIQILASRLQRANDPTRLAAFAKDIEWVGSRIIGPISGVLVVFGVALLIYSPAWNFSDTWILVGIAGFVITAVTGAAFLGPESGRLSKLVDEKGPADAEVRRRQDRIFRISRVDLVVLIVIVADMVFKPGS